MKTPKAWNTYWVATWMLLGCFVSSLGIQAAEEAKSKTQHNLTVCEDTEFALCAASTCTATGKRIRGNDGKWHDAVECTCPILKDNNIADLKGGNMKGRCTARNPKKIYSTFQMNFHYPQEVNGIWQEADAKWQL